MLTTVCYYLVADLFQMVTSVFPILLNSVIKSNGVCVCVCTHVPKHMRVYVWEGRGGGGHTLTTSFP